MTDVEKAIIELSKSHSHVQGQLETLVSQGKRVDIAIDLISETLQILASEKIRVDNLEEGSRDLSARLDNAISTFFKWSIGLFLACMTVIGLSFSYSYYDDKDIVSDFKKLQEKVSKHFVKCAKKQQSDDDEHKNFMKLLKSKNDDI